VKRKCQQEKGTNLVLAFSLLPTFCGHLLTSDASWLLIFIPGRKSSFRLCVWHECRWVLCYACPSQPDEHPRSLAWLRCKCLGLLPAAHGDFVLFCSCLLATVSTGLWQQESYGGQ